VTALAPFARTRVIAEDRSSGAVMLLDLTASTETRSTQPVTIVSPSVAEAKATASHDGEDDAPPVDMVTLTRFAAQQMYAPRRLLTPHPGIRRIAINPRPLDDLYVGAGVRAIPAAQWRSDALYVAALVLKNLGREPVELDPLSVRGRWQAITFQHGRLLASGSEADTTVVYLVCDRPFEACR
jgi:integrating conjugative element protein (TIGR03749 family)